MTLITERLLWFHENRAILVQNKDSVVFRHIQCVGTGVYATVCDKCRIIIAWSPKPEFLRIAEAAHERRHVPKPIPVPAIAVPES